jgi:mono/diheme cytochrome c family protein
MKKALKWIGIGVGGLVGLAVIVAAGLYVRGGSRLNRTYAPEVAAIPIPTDSAAIARGRHLVVAVTLCQGCHGDALEGDTLIDEPLMATIYASNLTAGRGGVGASYTDADYVRAIRHGVNPAGRGLMIMHSDAYHNLGEADLAAIIAYVRSVPPVDHEVPATRGGLLGRIFVALGFFDSEAMPMIAAEVIDHEAPFAAAPPAGETAEYGRYLMSIAMCTMCHGPDLKGGPPLEEGAPATPTLAAYGAAGGWSAEQFVTAIRTGVAPHGNTLDQELMPWELYAKMTDEELGAIWQYLASLNGR